MSEKKRLAVNMAATVIAFAVQFGVNFFLTPYIVNTLGTTAYGFVPLINNIIGYTSILTTALNSMAGRYIALAYNRGDMDKANMYFKSVFIANSLLAVVLAVPGFLFSAFPQWIMNVPANLLDDVRWAFLFSMLGTEISLVLSVFGCVYYVRNRLEKSSLRNIESNLLRAAILIGLFAALQPKIYYITATMLIVTAYNCAANIHYTRTLTPELGMSKGRFRVSAIKELLSSGIWNSIDSLSYTLLITLGLYLANLFVGPQIAGEFSLAKTVPSVLMSLGSTLVGVFAPQLMQYYAKGRQADFHRFMEFSLKVVAVTYALPVGFLIVFGTSFFDLWVPGQNVEFLQWMSVLTLIPTLFSCGSMVLNNVFIVTGKLKVPALAFLVCGVLNIVIVIPLLLWTDAGIWAIILVQAILDTLKNFIFLPWYASRCLSYSFPDMFRMLMRSVWCLAPVLLVCAVYAYVVPVTSWPGFFIAASVCMPVALIANCLIMLSGEERGRALLILRRRRG
ncbi:lipopolysaccharide biosynthesis protein [Bifidobacterium sp. 82T10]|uniref:Lipopolysaccharide biosynthesis protein n=1 Tax=Bifidobacterium miconis TaxID=2834435 RepID=A0ABS6WCE1_9BIFI|nr:lipopolysaccharide biosynthesis protein [Bifidobacterium miconis]MBW3091719.1 lipopolysaccharide biosynthesis protein [Bifidobacterium miconis]